MKHIKRLLGALCALVLSTTSYADLVQPLNPVSEDSPLRINIGAKGGFSANESDKFGASDLGGGIGFMHNVGYDFHYGLGLAYDYTSLNGRIFTPNSKNYEGNRVDVNLTLRYMPELADRFNLGLNMIVGWGRQFGQNARALNDSMSFGDMAFKVGPAISWGMSDMVNMYFAANYSLHNIRFGAKEKSLAAMTANWQGVDLPLGFWFGIADNTGLFVEANSRFINLAKGAHYFKEEVSLGLSFAI